MILTEEEMRDDLQIKLQGGSFQDAYIKYDIHPGTLSEALKGKRRIGAKVAKKLGYVRTVRVFYETATNELQLPPLTVGGE